MNNQQVIDIFSQLIYASVELSAPLLVSAMIVGIVISVFQAATQINESTLSFIPKVAVVIAVLLLTAPWMLRKMTSYTQNLYRQIPAIAKQR